MATDPASGRVQSSQEALEAALVLLANNHGRYVQVHKGQWGFSQGAAYNPGSLYLTLAQAVAAEVKTLRLNAASKRAEADRATGAAQALEDAAVLITSLLPTVEGQHV